MLGIRRYLRFDPPLRRFLGRLAPALSARGSASALRDGGPSAAARSSLHVIASIILLALIVAAVGGGDRILKRRLQSRPPHFSRPPSARYRPFRRCSDSVSDTLTKQAVVPPNASRSRGAGGTGPGAARGGPGEVQLEAHPSITISPRRSTVAPFMQLALSASSAIRPAACPLQQRSPSPAARLASTRTTQLALLQSAPSAREALIA